MIDDMTLIGIDVSRDWLDGFCLPGQKRFRYPNTADGHIALVAMIQQLSGPLKVGFEATGGHEWVLWTEFAAAGIIAVQLSPAQSEPSCRHAFETDGERIRTFPGHAGEDGPDRRRAHRPVHGIQTRSRTRVA